jgi:hypothetical protein
LLKDQSGSVLGDSTVFSWAGCHMTLATTHYEVKPKIIKLVMKNPFK